MRNLWDKDFKPSDVETPKKILDSQCEYLAQKTKGLITAKVFEYDEPIMSYTQKSIKIDSLFQDKTVNIQDNLGDIEDNKFTYEFFVSSVSTPNYKYRVMFIRYGITFYPVTIVLDESIAKELSEETIITCNNQGEFEMLVGRILNSQKLEKVISSLLAISTRDLKI